MKNIRIENDQQAVIEPSFYEEERQTILSNAKKEASLILEQAKKQADMCLENINKQQEEWVQEKKNLMERAYEEGLQIGIADGRLQGKAEYVEVIESAQKIVEQSKVAFHEHIESSETDILQIAIASAEKIIQCSLTDKPESFVGLVKKTIKEAKDSQEIQLHVNPIHYEFLVKEKQELEAVFPKEVQLYIYPDTELDEDACFIESENGRIDASISSQLTELKGKLLELLDGENK